VNTLIERTLAGDNDAWRTLQSQLEPTILSIARRHQGLRKRNLAGSQDDLREVVVATLERLSRDDFQNLRRFLERSAGEPSPDALDSWIYGAVDFVIREHLRQRFGRAPQPTTDPSKPRPPSKRDLQSHAGRIEDAETDRSLLQTLGMTTKLTAAQIFAHIDDMFEPSERLALHMYYTEDHSFAEIALALELSDAKEAERMIRRLNARLRYRFAPAGDADTTG
jgi:DNA-directed RNA polymerase specialized sigma24 family protein